MFAQIEDRCVNPSTASNYRVNSILGRNIDSKLFTLQLLRLSITDIIRTTETFVRLKQLVLVDILAVLRIDESFNIGGNLQIDMLTQKCEPVPYCFLISFAQMLQLGKSLDDKSKIINSLKGF
jgi:hypothetical protein